MDTIFDDAEENEEADVVKSELKSYLDDIQEN